MLNTPASVHSQALSPETEHLLILLVRGVGLALLELLEGRLHLLHIAPALLLGVLELLELVAHVELLEDVVHREHVRADAGTLEGLAPLAGVVQRVPIALRHRELLGRGEHRVQAQADVQQRVDVWNTPAICTQYTLNLS